MPNAPEAREGDVNLSPNRAAWRASLGEVTIKVDFGDGELITGKGASTDVIEASARAYVNAVNRKELAAQRSGNLANPAL